MKIKIRSFVACPRDYEIVNLKSCYKCVFYKGLTTVDGERIDHIECGGVIGG